MSETKRRCIKAKKKIKGESNRDIERERERGAERNREKVGREKEGKRKE